MKTIKSDNYIIPDRTDRLVMFITGVVVTALFMLPVLLIQVLIGFTNPISTLIMIINVVLFGILVKLVHDHIYLRYEIEITEAEYNYLKIYKAGNHSRCPLSDHEVLIEAKLVFKSEPGFADLFTGECRDI